MANNLPRARWQHFELVLDHASVTATTTIKMFKCPRRMQILKADYINPTGLVGDPTNAFVLTLQNASTVIATRSTDTDGTPVGSTITADTFTDMALASPAPILAEDDVLSFVMTEAGTATLPAGKVVVHCRYV